ncbi:DUF6221 family protein [Streptomyces sp. S1D4-20]|uniref:DUF6221 family protein n=1 Tax=Streptomyces sp. S1D4-20 TaxID=2594462 RepID=UPI001164F380|nr:DUF6221 family protein [Streptomyces sp. S1D4-20]QDN57361.1 hypothetical protein FNV67_20255 [Streptomyces sp. S1D4-20]
MPDLHGWITQQIERRETDIHSAEKDHGRTWAASWHAPTDSFQLLDDHGIVVASDLLPGAVALLAIHDPEGARRRCEADRRILDRHTLDPTVHWTPACAGCGNYGDMEMPYTENLNECPELLDLGYAHGLTPEILATLDQPETPARPERPDIPPPVHLNALVRLLSARPTSSVPPALRGPNWKP